MISLGWVLEVGEILRVKEPDGSMGRRIVQHPCNISCVHIDSFKTKTLPTIIIPWPWKTKHTTGKRTSVRRCKNQSIRSLHTRHPRNKYLSLQSHLPPIIVSTCVQHLSQKQPLVLPFQTISPSATSSPRAIWIQSLPLLLFPKSRVQKTCQSCISQRQNHSSWNNHTAQQ
jgi:hypothetical protein